MSKRWKRSREELIASLETQIQAMTSSCVSYDAGNEWEAVRLAASVYILVHDGGGKVRSILTQLGVRGSLRFLTYARKLIPGNALRSESLVMARVQIKDGKNVSGYSPKLNNGPPIPPQHVQFHTWWEDEKIISDPDGFFLNRRRLVWSMRDQDGGGHLDAEITDPAYVRVSRETINTHSVYWNGKSEPITGVHHATMRHLAWELLETIKPLPADLKQQQSQ